MVTMARLHVRDGARSWEVEVGPAGVLVGREEGAGVQSTLASTSQRHCRIDLIDGAWSIVDLGSTNGTYVNNGMRLGARVVLRDGDVVRCGPVGGMELRMSLRQTLVLPPVPPKPAVPQLVQPVPQLVQPVAHELPATPPGDVAALRGALAQARAEAMHAVQMAEKARSELSTERALLKLTETQVGDLRQDVASLRERWQEAEARAEEALGAQAPLRAAKDDLELKLLSLRQLLGELEAEVDEAHAATAAADQRARVLRIEQTAQQATIEQLRGVIEGQQKEIAHLTRELLARKG